MNSRSGFTLLELLIVIAISAVFSGFVIVYGHAGQNGVSLSVEEAKISQIILKAKDLSITTYTGDGIGCGDGVHFDPASGTYSLFVYSPTGATCPSFASTTATTTFDSGGALREYDSQSWDTHVAQGLLMSSATDAIADVLFYPPDPETLISRDDKTFLNPGQTSNIYLETVGDTASATISVSPTGQISTVQ